MLQGKAKAVLLGIQGLIGHRNAPDWGFIYETSLVQSSNWNLGDRVVLPDGREFRYAKSAAACYAGQAVQFDNTGFQGWGGLAVDQKVGDKQVTITGGSHAEVSKNELRGGYIFIAGLVTANKEVQFRGIIGNDYAALNNNVVIYLDGRLTNAITKEGSGNASEVFKNPYSAVRLAHNMSTSSKGKPGIAAVYVSAALTYFWIQTRGPAWMGSQTSLLAQDVGGAWRQDGSLEGMSKAITGSAPSSTAVTSQYAGYSMVGNNSGNGPLFMLQG